MSASTIGAERIGASTAPAPARTTKGAAKQPGSGAIWKIGTAVIVAYALFPVLWILSLSLKPAADVGDGKLIPTNPSLGNYRDIFTSGEFVRPLINSIGISLITTAIAVVIAAFAAYAIARLDFPGRLCCCPAPSRSPCSRRSASSARCSTSGARPGCTTPGPG
jgi:hypothetical protein